MVKFHAQSPMQIGMFNLSRMLDRGRLISALLLILPTGALLSTPQGVAERDGASAAGTTATATAGQWQVAEYNANAAPVQPITQAEILERFAAAGGTLSDGDASELVGVATEADEGELTTDLPADYVAGSPPDSKLAATLRASQARNSRAAVPAPQNLAQALTQNPHIIFTRQSQINDILSGSVDPRVIDVLTWIASRRGSITITSMRSDHSTCVAGSSPCRVSAHHLGRALDIAAVNGEPCGGTPTGQCGVLYEEIINTLRGTAYQPSQIIYGYDKWPSESWNFEMGNHHDHIHLGY